MNYALRYLFVLIWIAYLICSGVYLFSRGFLLSRVTKRDVNKCEIFIKNSSANDQEFTQQIVDNLSTNICLPRKSKVIILVIDALKYEFGIYNENKMNPLPYENKIRIFHELLQTENEYSRIFKFRADPPTTTLQRLKGFTTGSLPTFIDIGSNFATPEINEDNIIDQIVNNGLSVVFLGDNTWTDLYPKRFKRHYSYSSFNIYDLDTVDNNILKHLPNELDNSDWDVLIAHFLGVDHCGHRYGPLHDEMSRKLIEMDEIIRMVIKKMDSETTLFVISDHGMTFSGDHGGESDDEVNALVFAYSKAHKFLTVDVDSVANSTTNQIDLVPTLATILGVPIPYSNLGQINFNLIPDIGISSLPNYQLLFLHAWQNARQIYTYFYNYALNEKDSHIFNDLINGIQQEFESLKDRANHIQSESDFKNFYVDLNAIMKEILERCREIWIKFDANQMSQGLLLTFLPIFFSFLLINNSHVLEFSRIFNTNLILFVYTSNFIVGVLGYYHYKDLSMRTKEHGVIFVTALLSTMIFAFLTLQNWSDIAINWSNMKRFSNMPTRFIFIIAVSVFFSNSFIIQEQKILSYLIAALIIFMLHEIIQESIQYGAKVKLKYSTFLKSTVFKLIVSGIFAITMLRCAYQFFRCREEQNDCEDFSLLSSTAPSSFDNSTNFNSKDNSLATDNGTKLKINALSIIILALYTILTRIYLRMCGNLTGFSINVVLARYGPIIASISASGYILLLNSNLKHINIVHIDRMAWIVYVLFAIQLIVLFTCPLMTHVIVPNKTNVMQINPFTNVIPELFKRMKQAYDGNPDAINSIRSSIDKKSEIPIVYGLATIYSSVLISFGVFLLIFLVIILNGRPSLGIFICVAVAAVILNIHSILRYRTACKLETCTQPTFTAIVAWLLLAHFTFFATSHQTTLSQIEWRAAFVGRTSNSDHSNFISGILVIMNTFGGQILFMTLYSLLTSETFTIYALFPSLIRLASSSTKNSKKNLNNKNLSNNYNCNNTEVRLNVINKTDVEVKPVEFEITKGELILYENDMIYIGAIFKLACQFFMLQGLRIFCAMMACTIHCRHLMVWKIFAPRFIYEGIATLVSFPAIIFGYLIVIRLHWSVNKLIDQINKTK